MYPRRVFNVFFLLFCTYQKPRCFEQTAIDDLILVQSLVAVHHCRFAFKCNTHQHAKTIQGFSLPQNFIRKSEPALEHEKHSPSNAIQKVTCPRKSLFEASCNGRSHDKFSVALALCSHLNPKLRAPL